MDALPDAVTARWPDHTYCVCLVLGTIEVDPEHRALFEAGWHPLGNSPDTPLARKKHEDWARATHSGVTEVMFHPNAYDARLQLTRASISMWAR
ncbi:hypothetical protein HY634_03165 [Candidatus Uhrbacteria bacterium]|nr:hypothetical protein [Candidatus Uhrbacteria bacterium]